ncbi:hypothetical protein JCM15548_1539 [Geofilum rubicundum JCM 15548]|uniref:Uncharacterized protein n=2 Tax=Geofilum TaxID=1236988 RepID=A0A0E9LT33_9BACT|nr:hypothetical protein JCM15548_1539 [Geofilum rubicundum JCM 15548]
MLLMFVALATFKGSAQIEKHQATFIYNFTRLVQWPEFYKEPVFILGVIGSNEAITKELKSSMGDRTVAGKEIEIVEFASGADVKKCHLLFVPESKSGQLNRAVAALSNQPALIVTENQGRQPTGSVINFSIEDGKLGIRLDQELAEAKKLLVSRQLVNFSR